MERTLLLAILLVAMPAAAQICIVGKDGCTDISSGKVYEQQGGAYVDPETKEVKIPPSKEYETARQGQTGSKPSAGSTRAKVQLKKIP